MLAAGPIGDQSSGALGATRRPYITTTVRGYEPPPADYYYETGLPSVDDLEVAAAAAMADVASEASSVSSEDESMSASGSDGSESSGRPHSTAKTAAHSKEQGRRPVIAQLVVEGDAVRLHINLQTHVLGSHMDSMAADSVRQGIFDVRHRPAVVQHLLSDSDMSSDSEEEVPAVDALADIRARLNEAMDEDEEKVAVVSSVLDELPPVEPLDVEISKDDQLIPAGRVASVLEGVIIVQVPELGRVFSEGTVLCLEDRTPLGRVTELFGPIQAPLYALRYPGGAGPLPDSVTCGAHVCAVEKYAAALEADAVPRHAPVIEEEAEEDDPSFQFSDDEQEAEFHRQVAERTSAPSVEEGLRGHHGAIMQHSAHGGRGWDRGEKNDRGGGSTSRQNCRGRGGQRSPRQGPRLAAKSGHAGAGADTNGMAPSVPQWPAQPQQQGWRTPQQRLPLNSAPIMVGQHHPAFGSPAVMGQQMQLGGVQQLPDGSFVLPVSQQIVLTPQQVQQYAATGHLPAFVLQSSAPGGPQQYSTQQGYTQQFRSQFAGHPTIPQGFRQQQQQQQQQLAQPGVGRYNAVRPPPEPPRPPQGPPPSMYHSGV